MDTIVSGSVLIDHQQIKNRYFNRLNEWKPLQVLQHMVRTSQISLMGKK
jgi:hypothetical protein